MLMLLSLLLCAMLRHAMMLIRYHAAMLIFADITTIVAVFFA